MYKDRVEKAVRSIKMGSMVIIMDDEDRENEGDLVMAGIFSTPDKINFMAREARGLICVSVTEEVAFRLDLPPMVASNSANHGTAFTVSVDAKIAKTGISAYERDLTVRLICDHNSTPSDFARPGHIFPLLAKKGGVLVRPGHTEAGVDICNIAGITPVSVICEIMKEDGSMPGNGDRFLSDFSDKHGIPILYISDLVRYRILSENLVELLSHCDDSFLDVSCTKYSLVDYLGVDHFVYRFAPKASYPLVKFHHVVSDLCLFQSSCKYWEFMNSLSVLKERGGLLIFINGNCRKDMVFGIGAQILKALDITRFAFLGNESSPLAFLESFGLSVSEVVRVPETKL